MLLAPGLEIPDEVFWYHVVWYGKTRVGKTYSIKGVVEKLMEMGRRCTIIDPTGHYYGLRHPGLHDNAMGYPFVVFGGLHGDVPINENSATALVKLITEQNVPAIIDVSTMTVGKRTKFMTAFADQLYIKASPQRPMHLIIDEAHLFAPKNPPQRSKKQDGEEESGNPMQMLHNVLQLATGGNGRGIRLILASQRPAMLHNTAAAQCEALIAMKVIHPSDRKAVQAWVDGAGDPAKAKEILSSLASLPRGEGWVWAPDHGILQRAKFPLIRSFDSSKTPGDGDVVEPPKRLQDIDLSPIRAAMSETIKLAEKDDPKLLKKHVVDLEKQVKDLQRQLADERLKPIDVHAGDVGKLQDEIAQLKHDAYLSGRKQIADANSWRRLKESLQSIEELARDAIDAEYKAVTAAENEYDASRTTPPPREASESRATQAPERTTPKALAERPVPAVAPPQDRPAAGNGVKELQGDLPKATLKVWGAAAFFEAIGVVPTRQQVAFLAKIKPTTGTFSNYIGALRSAGIIDYPEQGLICVTDKGSAFPLGHVPKNRSQLLDYFEAELKGQHRAIFAVLREANSEMTREDLGKAIGVTSSSGTFSNYIGFLRGVGLIEYPSSGMVKLATWLAKWSPKARSA